MGEAAETVQWPRAVSTELLSPPDLGLGRTQRVEPLEKVSSSTEGRGQLTVTLREEPGDQYMLKGEYAPSPSAMPLYHKGCLELIIWGKQWT